MSSLARREKLAHVSCEEVAQLQEDLGLEELDGAADAILPPEEAGAIL